jgi:hypothetical protein
MNWLQRLHNYLVRTMTMKIQQHFDFPVEISHRPNSRSGLTLVELLVTIGLITVVSSMFMVAYRAAATEASNIRTQGTIRKISEVLMARMQEYDDFNVEVFANNGLGLIPMPSAMTPRSLLPGMQPPKETSGALLQRTKLALLRQVILQEMPDHPDDIKWSSKWVSAPLSASDVTQHIDRSLSVGRPYDTGLVVGNIPVYAGTLVTARTKRLISRLSAVDRSTGNVVSRRSTINGRPWDTNQEPWELRNANPELLYLVVEESFLNGSSAIELFGKSEIRDTDEDGLNEFVDAFGNPIYWVRWPTSNVNVVSQYPDLLDPNLSVSQLANDPLDRSKSDPGYGPYSTTDQPSPPSGASVPLIISPGPDRRLGLKISFYNPGDNRPTDGPVNRFGQINSFSVGDVKITLPYSPIPFVHADPWYPRSTTNGLGRLVDGIPNPPNSSIPSSDPYYDVPAHATDNITNFEVGVFPQ